MTKIKQIRELKHGDQFVYQGKTYQLDMDARDKAHPEYYWGKRGRALEHFLGGQEVFAIVPEAPGQLGMF